MPYLETCRTGTEPHQWGKAGWSSCLVESLLLSGFYCGLKLPSNFGYVLYSSGNLTYPHTFNIVQDNIYVDLAVLSLSQHYTEQLLVIAIDKLHIDIQSLMVFIKYWTKALNVQYSTV